MSSWCLLVAISSSPPLALPCEETLDSWEGCDDSLANEDTALLRTAAAATEIIITPMSPAASSVDLSHIDSQDDEECDVDISTTVDVKKMDLLKPDVISNLNEDVWELYKMTVVIGWVKELKLHTLFSLKKLPLTLFNVWNGVTCSGVCQNRTLPQHGSFSTNHNF